MRTSVLTLATLFTLVAAVPRAEAQESHTASQATLDAALQQDVGRSYAANANWIASNRSWTPESAGCT